MVAGPGPFRRGHVADIERIFRRIAGAHLKPILRTGQQDNDITAQHGGDLIGDDPHQIIQRPDACDLAAEGIKLCRRLGARRHGLRLALFLCRQVADHQCGDQEKDQRQDIGRIGDGKGVKWRQEKEIIGGDAEQRGHDRGPLPITQCAEQHRRQEHQRQVGQRHEAIDQGGNGDRDAIVPKPADARPSQALGEMFRPLAGAAAGAEDTGGVISAAGATPDGAGALTGADEVSTPAAGGTGTVASPWGSEAGCAGSD